MALSKFLLLRNGIKLNFAKHYFLFNHIVLFFLESWLCRSTRITGKLEDSVPDCCYDGTGQADHHAGQTGCIRFHPEYQPGKEVFHLVQAVRRTTHKTGKLSLSHKSVYQNLNFTKNGLMKVNF